MSESLSSSGTPPNPPKVEYEIYVYDAKDQIRKRLDLNKLSPEQREKIDAHFQELQKLVNKDQKNLKPLNEIRLKEQDFVDKQRRSWKKLNETTNAINQHFMEMNEIIAESGSPEKNVREIVIHVKETKPEKSPKNAPPPPPPSIVNVPNEQQSNQAAQVEPKKPEVPKTPSIIQAILDRLKKFQLFPVGFIGIRSKPNPLLTSPMGKEILETEKKIASIQEKNSQYKFEISLIHKNMDEITQQSKKFTNIDQIRTLHEKMLELIPREKWLKNEIKKLDQEKAELDHKLAEYKTKKWSEKKVNIDQLNEMYQLAESEKGTAQKRLEREQKLNAIQKFSSTPNSEPGSIQRAIFDVFIGEKSFYNNMCQLEALMNDKEFKQFAKERGLSNKDFSLIFSHISKIREASEDILLKYHTIQTLMKEGKVDEALTMYFDVMQNDFPKYVKTMENSAIYYTISQNVQLKDKISLDDLVVLYNPQLFSTNSVSRILYLPSSRIPQFTVFSKDLEKAINKEAPSNPQINKFVKLSEESNELVKEHTSYVNEQIRRYEGFIDSQSLENLLKTKALQNDPVWIACLKKHNVSKSDLKKLEKLYAQSGKDIEQLMNISIALELNPDDLELKEEARSLSLKVLKSINKFTEQYHDLGGKRILQNLAFAMNEYVASPHANAMMKKSVEKVVLCLDFFHQRTFYFDEYYTKNAEELRINIKK